MDHKYISKWDHLFFPPTNFFSSPSPSLLTPYCQPWAQSLRVAIPKRTSPASVHHRITFDKNYLTPFPPPPLSHPRDRFVAQLPLSLPVRPQRTLRSQDFILIE